MEKEKENTQIFSLYEPPSRPVVLPKDFKKKDRKSKLNIKEFEPSIGLSDEIKHRYRYFYRPYKQSTQKAVNNSLYFEKDKHDWIDVADIIINTKDKEFLNIIEFYRENHNKGYIDDWALIDKNKEMKARRRKKTKRGTFYIFNYRF